MYALIRNDTITHVGPLPPIWWDGNRWHDLRDGDGTYAAALGWLPITYQPRPNDTATTTWERADPDLVNGLPVVGWTERPKTEAELAAEAEQDARLDDLDARVARIEAHLWPTPPDPDTPDDPSVTDWTGIWPDGGLIREGGVVWRNISGVPLTTPPSGFPGSPSQWGHLFVVALAAEPDPEPIDAPNWTAGTPYTTGDVVTYNGKVYEVLQAHTSAAHWPPDQVASLYKPL